MSNEEAIRADERAKWAAEFERAAEWHRTDRRGDELAVHGFHLAAEQLREAIRTPRGQA